MRYDSDLLYRPPGEWRSYLLQCTIGCSHNKCTFCAMYKEKKFRVRPVEEILEDIDMARSYYGPNVERVFLMDGDAIVMRTEQLLQILEKLCRLIRRQVHARAVIFNDPVFCRIGKGSRHDLLPRSKIPGIFWLLLHQKRKGAPSGVKVIPEKALDHCNIKAMALIKQLIWSCPSSDPQGIQILFRIEILHPILCRKGQHLFLPALLYPCKRPKIPFLHFLR